MAESEKVVIQSRGGGEGKGGSVILITTTIFLGYLYFTGRLQRVWEAVTMPGDLIPGTGAGSVSPYNPTSVTPIPGVSSQTPISVRVIYPDGTGLPQEVIQTTPSQCRNAVYSLVFSRTNGNAEIAKAVSEITCVSFG